MKYNTTNTHRFTGKMGIALFLCAGLALVALTGCNQQSNSSQSQSASASDQTAQSASVSVSDPASASASQQTATAPAAQTAAPSAEHGQQLFTGTCSGCHGAQGQGVPHLGKDLQTSQFVSGLNDDKLADFITQGRAVTDPANTTHVPMPPKGGNPALSSQDISDIVAYLRQLQHEHTASK